MAYELHVRKHTVLGLLPAELQLLGIVELQLLVSGGESRGQRLELALADVEEDGLEGHRFGALLRRGELWEGGLETEDQVRVGLAVVWLGEGLLEDQADDVLELGHVAHLNLRDLGADGRDALRADLVQQALDRARHFLHGRKASGGCDAVGCGRRCGQRGRAGGRCERPHPRPIGAEEAAIRGVLLDGARSLEIQAASPPRNRLRRKHQLLLWHLGNDEVGHLRRWRLLLVRHDAPEGEEEGAHLLSATGRNLANLLRRRLRQERWRRQARI
mmetsp:Transcript_43150/g.92010  ORF Transcript_43150/g.92010 Transcript_43150/m.92010 type:complete len:273 (+) Transcript_43150:568-1386(+)